MNRIPYFLLRSAYSTCRVGKHVAGTARRGTSLVNPVLSSGDPRFTLVWEVVDDG